MLGDRGCPVGLRHSRGEIGGECLHFCGRFGAFRSGLDGGFGARLGENFEVARLV